MFAIAILFVLPTILASMAMLVAFALAARIVRKAESDYIPEATPGETAEWIASFDAIDVDAEWIAIADAKPCFRARMSEVCKRVKARNAIKAMAVDTLDLFDAIDELRAALDASEEIPVNYAVAA